MALQRVAVGVSGGVDSAVAAWILKKKGYDVHGVYMRNWDARDEEGTKCQSDQESQEAAWVCDAVGIPFTEMNFVAEYWNEVFQYLLKEYSNGRTPNPDILCNRHIKFGSLAAACRDRLGADWLATGHYARLADNGRGGVRLMLAADPSKDQTFFMSGVEQNSLRQTIFPVGGLHKTMVRQLAEEAGLTKVAHKKDSTGICFIGNRNFKNFIAQYLPDRPGRLLDVETGEVLGQHSGQHLWTLGQRCAVTSFTRCFVAEKLAHSPDMLACGGGHHPSLYSSSLVTGAPHWLGGSTPAPLLDGGMMEGLFRFQHRHPLVRCWVTNLPLMENASDAGLVITLEHPVRVITPGQFAVLYRDGECLGSATIVRPGPSLYSLNTNGCRDYLQALRVRRLPSLLNEHVGGSEQRTRLEQWKEHYRALVNTSPLTDQFTSLLRAGIGGCS